MSAYVIVQVIPYDATREIQEVYAFKHHVILEGMRCPDEYSPSAYFPLLTHCTKARSIAACVPVSCIH